MSGKVRFMTDMSAINRDGDFRRLIGGVYEAEIVDEDSGPGRVSFLIIKNGWLVKNVPFRCVETEETITIW